MSVRTKHADYIHREPDWKRVRDCVEGERHVKLGGEAYLPSPDFTTDAKQGAARYAAYLDRAVFYPVTGRTLSGFTGTVFAKDPTINVPTSLEEWLNDVDGCGTSLIQQSKMTFREVMSLGRCGLLVDYPNTTSPTSRADQQQRKIRPTIVLYSAEAVYNWRTKVVNGVRQLSLVVLRETEQRVVEQFTSATYEIFRVLYIDEETGNYAVQLHVGPLNGNLQPQEVFVPLNGAGQPWKEIPFTFVGAVNNDASVDLPPLMDLASLNVAHYRNSADYEDSVHVVGQPTPVFTGLTEHWVTEVLKNRVVLGSRSAVPLPAGANAMLLQAAPNSLCQTAMEIKERQMVAIGAKLVMQASVQRTATESASEAMAELSTLASVAANVGVAYVKALEWFALFANVGGASIQFEFSKEYLRALLDAQTRSQLVAEWQSGAISFTEMRESLRRAGVAFEPDEKVKAEAEAGIDPLAPEPGTNEDDEEESE
jgi:hypothetical protein